MLNLFNKYIIKYVIDICVVVFLYILFNSHPNVKIRDSNYHTHCEYKSSYDFGEYDIIDLENPHQIHDPIKVSHTHDNNDVIYKNKIKQALPPFDYDEKNLYMAGYDIKLEYILKILLTCIIVTCALITHTVLP